ncbi:MAG TPA: hypothetical protein VD866_06380 [Urbifossiella sp.]|nr:hypothetical protein [Urbifossiella sp.]
MTYLIYAAFAGVGVALYAFSHRKEIAVLSGTEGFGWFALEVASLCVVLACLGLFVMACGLVRYMI